MSEAGESKADGEGGDIVAPARRAGTVQAIGVMALIAVVASAAVVTIMRVAPAPAADRPAIAGLDDVAPTELGGGVAPADVPEEVAAVVDLPVIGARELDELPDGVEGCNGMFGPGDPHELESVLLTPDVLLVSIVGLEPEGADMGFSESTDGEPPQWRETCTLTMSGGGWENQGSSMGLVDDHLAAGGMMTGSSCCDADGLATATAELAGPVGATWALQERGAYWLAYPLPESGVLQLSWRYREGGFVRGGRSTHVLWVDDEGTIYGDQFVDA